MEKMSTHLLMLALEHTHELFRLVNRNREHLREWLPWVDTNTTATDTEKFIQSTIVQFNSGRGPQYAIYHESVMCGVCGFLPIDRANRGGMIGYWLSQEFTGRGIMTGSVRQLLEVGFRDCSLNRVEIACATGNLKSRAIPERLGFKFEGVLRGRELVAGTYVDHAIYSMLACEYAPSVRA